MSETIDQELSYNGSFDADRASAIERGEADGAAQAAEVHSANGMEVLKETLRPGQDPWQRSAFHNRLASKAGVHPYHLQAYDEAFARAARAYAERAVAEYSQSSPTTL